MNEIVQWTCPSASWYLIFLGIGVIIGIYLMLFYDFCEKKQKKKEGCL